MTHSKSAVKDLALFGGTPSFSEARHVGRPLLATSEMLRQRLDGVLERKYLTNYGPEVRELEERLADYLRVRHCICVANGTVGLTVLAMALGLKGEVIVPAFTFIATPHSLAILGITPKFCDVDPVTHCMDPAAVKRLIGPRTSAIMGVHLWGNPSAVTELKGVADTAKIPLLFDAAHAFGSRYRGAPIGQSGMASVLSFHATKVFNTAEGGAILTADDQLAQTIRRMINFGFTGYDQVSSVGMNGKMSELSGAMGLANFMFVQDFIHTNQQNYLAYRSALDGIPGIDVMKHSPDNGNFQYVVAQVSAASFGLTRDQLVETLQAERILARRYFSPGCHRMEPYASTSGSHGSLDITEALSDTILALPTGPQMSQRDIVQVGDVIRLIAKHARDVSGRLLQQSQNRQSA